LNSVLVVVILTPSGLSRRGSQQRGDAGPGVVDDEGVERFRGCKVAMNTVKFVT
jgi:hypothetical protein